MKQPKIFYCLLAISLLFSCQKNGEIRKADSSDFIILKGATLYDGTGQKLENSIIVIKDGIIVNVGTSEDIIPQDAVIKDVRDKFITPGLVDAHVHFFQTGFFDARPDALNLKDSLPYNDIYEYQVKNPERYYEAYLRSGITAVYDVGDFSATLNFQKDSTNLDKRPHIANAGPLLTPFSENAISGFNVPTDKVMVSLNSPQIGENHVKVNTARGATGIKIWSLNTKDSIFMESLAATAKIANEVGNHLIVHATTLEQAKAALQFNVKLLVHSVEDTVVDSTFIELALKNKTYYNPTLIVGRGYYNAYKAILGEEFIINDPNGVLDERTKLLLEGASGFQKYVGDVANLENRMLRTETRLSNGDSIMAINLKKVFDAGIPIVVGTDAGNPGTLHGVSIFDEMEAMQKAGLNANDIIVMATKNGAEAMQKGDKIGTIETGKIADLVIMDHDPSQDIRNMRSLRTVMRNGQFIDVTKKFD